MNSTVTASYQLMYVAISFAISVLGAFVALTAATRIRQRNGRINFINTASAGLALGGIGVWSMHFIGMVALKMDVATSYSLIETGISLVAAIVASGLALGYVAKAPERLHRMLLAGFLLGLGVVVMHYLGMFGLRFGGYIAWNYGIVALSALMAIVAATAALWLAFNTRTVAMRGAAALLMGVAVCSMHYTGMTAADFICTTANRTAVPQGPYLVNSMNLSTLVAIAALVMAAMISMDQAFQRAHQRLAPARPPAR